MPRNLRVVLIGIAAPGRTEQTIRDEARAFGVKQELEIKSNLDIDAVTRHQCDAKIAAIFSRREGSCVVVAESLFAGTPVAMDREAHIGSRRYINEQTGIFTDRGRVARQLTEFLERAPSLEPRRWAEANISCWESSKRMNRFLREHAQAHGRPWREDAADLCWRHMPRHAKAEDAVRLEPAKLRFEEEFGIRLL
jgi:glycosyltransferase involved in cell wall biosynthesis